MSNSSTFSGAGADDDGFVVLTESERAAADIPASGENERSALPVVVDDDDDDDEYSRTAIDLDDLGGSSRQPLDLSSLIGQLEERPKKARSQVPEAQQAYTDGVTKPIVRAAPGTDEAALRSEIVRLKEELEKKNNDIRRAMADRINDRRKAETDRQRYVQDAIEGFAKKVAEVMDDFYRGLQTTSESKSYERLADGIHAVLRNFQTMLGGYGIKEVDTTGSLFDVELHEAMGIDHESELPEDTIVEELRKGYTIDGRLLRAAMVKVARRHSAPLDINEDAALEPTAEDEVSEPIENADQPAEAQENNTTE